MKRLRSNMAVYEVYINKELHKTCIADVIVNEFSISRQTINQNKIRRNNKIIEFKQIATIKDYLEYALYRGDKLIDIDTIDNLAKTLNVKVSTIQWYLCKANKTNTTCDRVGLSIDVEEVIDIGDCII